MGIFLSLFSLETMAGSLEGLEVCDSGLRRLAQSCCPPSIRHRGPSPGRPGKQHECRSAAGSEQSQPSGGAGTESQGCLLSRWPWAQGSHFPRRRKNGGDRSRAFTTPLG